MLLKIAMWVVLVVIWKKSLYRCEMFWLSNLFHVFFIHEGWNICCFGYSYKWWKCKPTDQTKYFDAFYKYNTAA